MRALGARLLLEHAACLPPSPRGRGCWLWPWRGGAWQHGRRGDDGGASGGPLLEEGSDAGGGGAGGGPCDEAPQLLFGFHKPPWRSVDHLHMHCFLLPLKPCVAWKYRFKLNWVTAEDLEAQLAAETAAPGPPGKGPR